MAPAAGTGQAYALTPARAVLSGRSSLGSDPAMPSSVRRRPSRSPSSLSAGKRSSGAPRRSSRRQAITVYSDVAAPSLPTLLYIVAILVVAALALAWGPSFALAQTKSPPIPGVPPAPGTPAAPGTPPAPGTPAAPGTPPAPGTPAAPGTPPAPGTPAAPGAPPAAGASPAASKPATPPAGAAPTSPAPRTSAGALPSQLPIGVFYPAPTPYNPCYQRNVGNCVIVRGDAIFSQAVVGVGLRIRSSLNASVDFFAAFYPNVDSLTAMKVPNLTQRYQPRIEGDELWVGVELYFNQTFIPINLANNTAILQPCPTPTPSVRPSPSTSPSPSSSSSTRPVSSGSPGSSPSASSSPSTTASPKAPSNPAFRRRDDTGGGLPINIEDTLVENVNCTKDRLAGYLPIVRYTTLSTALVVPHRTAIVALRDGEPAGFAWDSSRCMGCPLACIEGACAVDGNVGNLTLTVYIGWAGTDARGKLLRSASLSLDRLERYGFW